MSHIGYARVSTLDQDPALQLDALAAAGCSKIFEDRISGARADRPGLRQALDYVRDGDVLIVWKLDRLGRSLPHLIETVAALEKRGVGFRSITEAIDTTTPGGRLVFHLFGALGQFERDLIRERTRAGLAAAAARGRKGGRKPVVNAEKLARARSMVAKGLTVREAAIRLKLARRRSMKPFGSLQARICHPLLPTAEKGAAIASADDIDREIADLNERLTTLDRERSELADRLSALELARARESTNRGHSSTRV